MRIEELMTRFPATCGPDDTLREAAWRMWTNGCGCVPVTDACQRVVGIITDRDICMAAVLLGTSLKDIGVGEAMTSEVHTCAPKDDLVEAQAIMQEAGVRRLPVVDESEQLVGVISLADLQGRSIRDRAMALISIAHPSFRAELRSAGKERHYVFMDLDHVGVRQSAELQEEAPDQGLPAHAHTPHPCEGRREVPPPLPHPLT